MSYSLVTIGILCYNADKTIARAISSALSQDWPHIEILVVDDVSTDNSIAVVENAITNADNARLIRHKNNTGPAGARNSILQHAKGEFIVFFDDDDESLPNRILAQIACLEQYEQETGAKLIACYASGNRRYENGYTLELNAIGSRGAEKPHGPKVADYLLLFRRQANWFYGTGTPTCSLLARKSTFDTIGGFDAQLRRVEDADFAIRLSLRGGHFIGTQDRLFVQYSTAAADKSLEKNLESEQLLAEKNKSYLDTTGSYYYARHWPLLRYWHFKGKYGRFLLELVGLLARYPITASSHILMSGPKRWLHERKMARKNYVND